MSKAPKCKAHGVCYCHCLWTPGQRAAAGIASMPFAMDSAPVALDSLSDDEMDMIRAAMKSTRPTARRSTPAQDQRATDPNEIYKRLHRSDISPYHYDGN